MNETQFLQHFYSLRSKGWKAHVGYYGIIVLIQTKKSSKLYCPITAVCVEVKGEKFLLSGQEAAAKVLGLTSEVYEKILRASDLIEGGGPQFFIDCSWRKILRMLLLEAFDLAERRKPQYQTLEMREKLLRYWPLDSDDLLHEVMGYEDTS